MTIRSCFASLGSLALSSARKNIRAKDAPDDVDEEKGAVPEKVFKEGQNVEANFREKLQRWHGYFQSANNKHGFGKSDMRV
eukprot:602030-Amphidinium_carterae.1